MKEIHDIVSAYRRHLGTPMVLATVVAVEGSSYRRPGARMLVMGDASLVGAISGGCLEGDARRKAMFALAHGKNRLATYDTRDEDGEMFGIQLGCHGLISILFEPIPADRPNHPLALLEALAETDAAGCLATLFTAGETEGSHPGTCALYRAEGKSEGSADPAPSLAVAARRCLEEGRSLEAAVGGNTALLHYVPPPVTLVIVGAGNDAMPLARFASELGWHVTVIDGRVTHATVARFPTAQKVRVVKPGEALPPAMAYVMMSHNFPYDLAALQQLQEATPRYIGLLGPGQRREELLRALAPHAASHWGMALHGPAGLDLAAETAEEIALSIVAEITAVLGNASAKPLRDKPTPIHPRANA